MLNIIAGGDSFTAQTDEYLAWPNYIKNANLISCAEMASGNELIARNVIAALTENPNTDLVIIGWSEPSRFELYFEKQHSHFQELRNHFYKLPGFIQLQGLSNPEGYWIKSGGGYGVYWKFNYWYADRLMETFIKHFHNDTLQYMKTMESILRVQWYCKAHNIKLINFKAWNHSLFHELHNDTQHLKEMIDFDTWWLLKEHQGLLEWVKDIKQIEDVPYGKHPLAASQQQFAKEVIQPMVDKYNA